MSVNLLTEILAAHADQLNRGDAAQDAFKNAFPADDPQRDELNALMDIAARTKRALTPVSPKPAFRAHLREGLMMAAHHQHAHNTLNDRAGLRAEVADPPADPAGPRGAALSGAPWGWLLGAAALGSAAGLIAIALRARQANRSSTQPVAHESVN